jgi:hypothetical protein
MYTHLSMSSHEHAPAGIRPIDSLTDALDPVGGIVESLIGLMFFAVTVSSPMGRSSGHGSNH